jgi:F-type H+-transporting ATPase subunit b
LSAAGRLGFAAALAALAVARPAHAAEGGIEIFPDPTLLVVLLVGFVLLIAPVNALLVKPLLRVAEERERRIEGARERAKQVASEADRVLAQYRGAVEAARVEAAQMRRQRIDVARQDEKAAVAAARKEAEGRLVAARRELGEALAVARKDLAPRAQELARDAAERLLGRSLS